LFLIKNKQGFFIYFFKALVCFNEQTVLKKFLKAYGVQLFYNRLLGLLMINCRKMVNAPILFAVNCTTFFKPKPANAAPATNPFSQLTNKPVPPAANDRKR
jgi:hypothetical protein